MENIQKQHNIWHIQEQLSEKQTYIHLDMKLHKLRQEFLNKSDNKNDNKKMKDASTQTVKCAKTLKQSFRNSLLSFVLKL